MLNVIHTLEHMGISSTCYTQAVQEVREQINGKVTEAKRIIHQLIEIDEDLVQFADVDEALMVTQALVEEAIKNGGSVGNDPEEAFANAKKRYQEVRSKLRNKWMFVKPESMSVTITETKEVGGVETQVAVNKEGGFKKGEKERLAMELYQKFQKESPDPNNNQAFIGILMKELGMSKAGATTYNYNMKKKFGGTIVAKPKRAK